MPFSSDLVFLFLRALTRSCGADLIPKLSLFSL
jgi:hypothetical protein